MISFNSYAEWSLVARSTDKNEYYIDFDRVSKNNGYVYYWTLTNFPSPPYAEGKSSIGIFPTKKECEYYANLFREKNIGLTSSCKEGFSQT